MEYILEMEEFLLCLKPKVFESDIHLTNNTIMEVMVCSNGFSAQTSMDIDVKDLAVFSCDVKKIYDTLSGEARLEEPYGMHMYLSFIGDGRGHMTVKGFLHKETSAGNEQNLTFENEIDQTGLQDFSRRLVDDFAKYREA